MTLEQVHNLKGLGTSGHDTQEAALPNPLVLRGAASQSAIRSRSGMLISAYSTARIGCGRDKDKLEGLGG